MSSLTQDRERQTHDTMGLPSRIYMYRVVDPPTWIHRLVHDARLDYVGRRPQRGGHQPGGERGACVRDGVVSEAPVLAEEPLVVKKG